MRNAQVLFFASIGAGVAAVLALSAGGCGGSNAPSNTGPGSSSSSSSSSSSGSGSGSGSGTTSSSGSSSSSSSGGPVGLCPATCPSGQFCCAQRTSAAPTTSCAAPTDCADAGTVQCTKPSDCQAGQVCCGPSGSTQPLGTQCMTACAASGYLSRQICQTPADCPNLTYTCPTSKVTDSTGGLYKTCHPPVADAGTGTTADAASE